MVAVHDEVRTAELVQFDGRQRLVLEEGREDALPPPGRAMRTHAVAEPGQPSRRLLHPVLGAYVLPTMPFNTSEEHAYFAGSVSLGPAIVMVVRSGVPPGVGPRAHFFRVPVEAARLARERGRTRRRTRPWSELERGIRGIGMAQRGVATA